MRLVASPEVQGRGQGSRLLKPALECLRRAGVPLYLETHKPVNTQIYAHLGFRQADVSTIPGTRVAQYAMLKPGTPELGAKNGAHPAGWLRPIFSCENQYIFAPAGMWESSIKRCSFSSPYS